MSWVHVQHGQRAGVWVHEQRGGGEFKCVYTTGALAPDSERRHLRFVEMQDECINPSKQEYVYQVDSILMPYEEPLNFWLFFDEGTATKFAEQKNSEQTTYEKQLQAEDGGEPPFETVIYKLHKIPYYSK